MLLRIAIALTLLLISPALGAISDPTDISDLVLWTDAQDVNGTGTQPSNGAAITTWADKSGNGNNLTTAAGTVTYESTGFDGINPGLRFPLVARMTGTNPFAGITQDEVTIFFVNSNVSYTNNFAVSLNGTATSSSSTNGRFSFHAPWTNNNIYFDAGGCCGSVRLSGANPNAVTETTLYTGLNDQPGSSQLLRIDGQPLQSDTNAISPYVSGGIHLGDLPGRNSYNGRFAEVVIYERALTMPEIQDVECYLLLKWKPSAATSTCGAKIAVEKTNTVWDPDGLDLHAVPGNDILYAIRATHQGGPNLDNDTMFFVDTLPSEVTFYNGDVDDAGPQTGAIGFTESGSGITFTEATDVKYSNAAPAPLSMADCTYTPNSGYDANVRYICFNPKGAFQSGSPNPHFELSFRARIK